MDSVDVNDASVEGLTDPCDIPTPSYVNNSGALRLATLTCSEVDLHEIEYFIFVA